MKDTRSLTSLCSGLLLYGVCWTLAWMLASIHLPGDLFPYAIWNRGSLGSVLSEAGAIALLLFLIALAWSYFTVRSPKLGKRPTTAWCLAGLTLAWFAWLLIGVFKLSESETTSEQSLSVILFSAAQPPLWGLLNTLALLMGAVVAGVLAGKHYRKLGGGKGRTMRAKNMRRRERTKQHAPHGRAASRTTNSTDDAVWLPTRPMSELPEAAGRLHMPMGQTGR